MLPRSVEGDDVIGDDDVLGWNIVFRYGAPVPTGRRPERLALLLDVYDRVVRERGSFLHVVAAVWRDAADAGRCEYDGNRPRLAADRRAARAAA